MGMPHATFERMWEAYLMMAKTAKYRPAAPSDGLGHIQLSSAELADLNRITQEAADYVMSFRKEEDSLKFWIGCSNSTTNRAFMWTIEAARCLAGGGDDIALALLEMALAELKALRKAKQAR